MWGVGAPGAITPTQRWSIRLSCQQLAQISASDVWRHSFEKAEQKIGEAAMLNRWCRKGVGSRELKVAADLPSASSWGCSTQDPPPPQVRAVSLHRNGAAGRLAFPCICGHVHEPFFTALCELILGVCGGGGGVMVYHGFTTSFLEQWLELTAVPVTDSFIPLVLCVAHFLCVHVRVAVIFYMEHCCCLKERLQIEKPMRWRVRRLIRK